MDILMPKLGGLEATDTICKSFPETTVVVISTESDISSIRGAMAAGRGEYFRYPMVFRFLS